MEFTGLGGGVMLAVAAGLWLVYLVPSWLRRREYLSTERNAVRLQQTLRVLAETAEVPATVRVETSARGVAEQQRILRQAEQRAEAISRAREAAAARVTARQLEEAQPALAAVVSARSVATHRLRRTRVVTALVLLAALVTLAVQGLLIATTGVAVGAWAVLAFAGIAAITSLVLLNRLASVSRARTAAVIAPAEQRARRVTMSEALPQALAPASAPWTPVPLPKPLYLSRSVIQRAAIDTAAAVAELQAAAAASELAMREAQQSPEVTPIIRRSPPSRFAAMGVVDPMEGGATDLDEVLRRRRAAG